MAKDNDYCLSNVNPMHVGVHFSIFPSLSTDPIKRVWTLRKFGQRIATFKGRTKHALYLFNLTEFGDQRSPEGSLRHAANAIRVVGIEGDHDHGDVSPEDAVARLEALGIAALIYTTLSHGLKGNRWRVVCVLSRPVEPAQRAELVAMLNFALGGCLARESFTLSTCFYWGEAEMSEDSNGTLMPANPVQVYEAKGDFIDCVGGLGKDWTSPGRRNAVQPCQGSDDPKEPCGIDLDEIIAALHSLPNDGRYDYHDWVRIGMALKMEGFAAGREDDAEDAWYEWSMLFADYDDQLTTKNWKGFQSEPQRSDAVTGATIIWMKNEYEMEKSEQPSAEQLLTKEDVDPAIDVRTQPSSYKPVSPLKKLDEKDIPAAARQGLLDHQTQAKGFAKVYSSWLKYDLTEGVWRAFDGQTWAPVNEKQARHSALLYCGALEASKRSSISVGQRKQLLSKRYATDVFDTASLMPEMQITHDQWPHLPDLLATPAGVVDLKSGESRDAQPDDLIRQKTAAAPGGECSVWLRFIDEATGGDKDLALCLQVWAGYTLTGHTREERFVFAHGMGGSGKSTFFDTISAIMGSYAGVLPMTALRSLKYDQHPTDLAGVSTARMVAAHETGANAKWNEPRIKAMVSGENTQLTARFMRGDFFTYSPRFKLSITGNEKPQIQDTSGGMQRRLLLLPFMHPPARMDRDLADKLREEWPGILKWAIDGAFIWYQCGLLIPDIVKRETQKYFEAEDHFGTWLRGACERVLQEKCRASDLYDSWSAYAFDHEIEPGSQNRFFPEEMQRRGFEKTAIDGRAHYVGVRLLR
ncbi:phage/plasmid primase, P4 family [Ruegeria sp. HKCCSP335]|uniref:phage/plasmid primase, P4 family n=1 Tax=Ruegeria sp. HKCCSP335 TaxID=2794833 RepID=UPI001AE2F3F6|nr:phage/plasmid primase, P4 family [Ruegeria sp. HKCCSP335]